VVGDVHDDLWPDISSNVVTVNRKLVRLTYQAAAFVAEAARALGLWHIGPTPARSSSLLWAVGLIIPYYGFTENNIYNASATDLASWIATACNISWLYTANVNVELRYVGSSGDYTQIDRLYQYVSSVWGLSDCFKPKWLRTS
jgi:hypothetical protein